MPSTNDRHPADRPVRLTKQQLQQLRELAKEPQPTYGSGRARVQNNLVYLGLAQYVDCDGRPVKQFFSAPLSWFADRCVITEAGRQRLKQEE